MQLRKVRQPHATHARGPESASIPDVLHQPLGADLGAENIAHGVGRDTLRSTRASGLFDRIRYQGGYRSVARLANANAALPTVVIFGDGFRFRIGDVDNIALVDVDAARAAELRPLVEIIAVLIEDLDAIVIAVTDKKVSARIHRERVRGVELARSGSLLAPGLDELAVLGEFDDARVGVAAVSVADENITIGCDQNGRRCVERVRGVARRSGLTEREQNLAVLALGVGSPDVAVAVDKDTVRKHEHSGAEALHKISRSVEFEHRIEI